MEYRIIASSVYEPAYLERVIMRWYYRPAKQATNLPAIRTAARPSIDSQLIGTRKTPAQLPVARLSSSHHPQTTGPIPLHKVINTSGSVPISTQPAILQTAGEFEIESGIRLIRVSTLGDLNRDYFFWQENTVLVVEPFGGQHRWVKLKEGWNNPQVANPAPVSLGRFTPDRATPVPVNEMTSTEKLAEAARRAIPGIIKRGGEAVREQVQALLDPETIAVMLALVGVSTVFPVVGLGLAIAGVYFLGADAIDVLKNLIDFVQKATTAQSESDLDAASECLVTVIVVGGVVAWELLSRKKGKRRKLVKKQEPGGQITEPIAHTHIEEPVPTSKKKSETPQKTPKEGSRRQGVLRLAKFKTHPPFKRNPKHSQAEFDRQLKGQQEGLNELTVEEYLNNRDAYLKRKTKTGDGRSPEGSKAQIKAREEARMDKIEELERAGKSSKDAEAEAEAWLKTQNALHDPDQIAGGNPNKISGMGDAGVNKSIGSQWEKEGRAEALDKHVREQAEKLTPEERKTTKLDVELTN